MWLIDKLDSWISGMLGVEPEKSVDYTIEQIRQATADRQELHFKRAHEFDNIERLKLIKRLRLLYAEKWGQTDYTRHLYLSTSDSDRELGRKLATELVDMLVVEGFEVEYTHYLAPLIDQHPYGDRPYDDHAITVRW